MHKKLPIGIFDSGFGGLSVAKSIHNLLPIENLIYVADSAFTPYGDLPENEIVKRSILITEFLVRKKNSKAIVVACNTATAFSINELRKKFNIPTAKFGIFQNKKDAKHFLKNTNIKAIITYRPIVIREKLREIF